MPPHPTERSQSRRGSATTNGTSNSLDTYPRYENNISAGQVELTLVVDEVEPAGRNTWPTSRDVWRIVIMLVVKQIYNGVH